jgi:hypothetical protein
VIYSLLTMAILAVIILISGSIMAQEFNGTSRECVFSLGCAMKTQLIM